jgi:hypothetical protein
MTNVQGRMDDHFDLLVLNCGNQNCCGARGLLNFDFAPFAAVVVTGCCRTIWILIENAKHARRDQNSSVLIGRSAKLLVFSSAARESRAAKRAEFRSHFDR